VGVVEVVGKVSPLDGLLLLLLLKEEFVPAAVSSPLPPLPPSPVPPVTFDFTGKLPGRTNKGDLYCLVFDFAIDCFQISLCLALNNSIS
jgi:hypothetical protein